MKLAADFTDLLTAFADHEVDFALIGGWALACTDTHGAPTIWT